MLTFPCAKINIGLNITGKRDDGFHSLETFFYPVGLCDVLEVVPDPDGGNGRAVMNLTGIELDGDPASNLVVRAYRLLSALFDLPSVEIHLHKVIPPGGGLGGGSSDGASMLLLLNRLFDLDLTRDRLRGLAQELGSDCPFFIDPVPSVATGRGEILKPFALDIRGLYVWLFHPGAGISTTEAYRNIRPAPWPVGLADALLRPQAEWPGQIRNDFEPFAFSRIPLIREIREACYQAGALYSSMTGSGSAVYALFTDRRAVPESILPYLIWEGSLV
ncbi:MAG: 4-(cytidine 5'-diphospho)-2-C-methyl-D-erythritol kinase [Bacteroidales bacterium]